MKSLTVLTSIFLSLSLPINTLAQNINPGFPYHVSNPRTLILNSGRDLYTDEQWVIDGGIAASMYGRYAEWVVSGDRTEDPRNSLEWVVIDCQTGWTMFFWGIVETKEKYQVFRSPQEIERMGRLESSRGVCSSMGLRPLF